MALYIKIKPGDCITVGEGIVQIYYTRHIGSEIEVAIEADRDIRVASHMRPKARASPRVETSHISTKAVNP